MKKYEPTSQGTWKLKDYFAIHPSLDNTSTNIWEDKIHRACIPWKTDNRSQERYLISNCVKTIFAVFRSHISLENFNNLSYNFDKANCWSEKEIFHRIIIRLESHHLFTSAALLLKYKDIHYLSTTPIKTDKETNSLYSMEKPIKDKKVSRCLYLIECDNHYAIITNIGGEFVNLNQYGKDISDHKCNYYSNGFWVPKKIIIFHDKFKEWECVFFKEILEAACTYYKTNPSLNLARYYKFDIIKCLFLIFFESLDAKTLERGSFFNHSPRKIYECIIETLDDYEFYDECTMIINAAQQRDKLLSEEYINGYKIIYNGSAEPQYTLSKMSNYWLWH